MSEVVMPRLSDTMEEGELSKWLKNVGDKVAKGDILAEIETDKATMDLEAFESGVLEQQLVEAGTVVPIGTPVAVIGEGSGKKTPAAKPSAKTPPVEEPPVEEPPVAEPPQVVSHDQSSDVPPVEEQSETASPKQQSTATSSARTSPLARKIAKEHGIDLASLAGSGPQGRIVRADVQAAIAASPDTSLAVVSPAVSAQATATQPSVSTAAIAATDEEVPVNRIRMVAAKRLTESQAVPHFFLTSVVNVDKLIAFRVEANASLESQGVKVSINDLLVRAAAVALRQHPEANSSWGGDKIMRHGRVNIGIAVATEAGLLVPVIRDADGKSLAEIARTTVTLAAKARESKLTIDEMTGGTFSISNLGMFGIDQFTAVINPPEAAILAVGAASAVPVLRDGVLVDVSKLKITLTVDHRVMDGAVAAAFLRDLVGILEQPLRMVV
ncbi:MAG: dihydrolipoamide acetyltransferase family protein [Terrimesophilobacter sp.]